MNCRCLLVVQHNINISLYDVVMRVKYCVYNDVCLIIQSANTSVVCNICILWLHTFQHDMYIQAITFGHVCVYANKLLYFDFL